MAQALPEEVDIDGAEEVDIGDAVKVWKKYLKDRQKGVQDSSLPRDLFKKRFIYTGRDAGETLQLWKPNTSGTPEEQGRYEGEQDFFDCHDNENLKKVEDLLALIVRQRYRLKTEQSKSINLRGVPARRVIAAERLFQSKLISLSPPPDQGARYYVPIGLDTQGDARAPKENYLFYLEDEAYDISLYHRSEPKEPFSERTDKNIKDVCANRVGFKYAEGVSPYLPKTRSPATPRHANGIRSTVDNGIIAQLKKIFTETLSESRKDLCDIFRQMCSNHIVSLEKLVSHEKLRELEKKDREQLEQFLRNCFHILINEQCQFHSACFEVGDQWKIGMTVSFARLLKLFNDGHIPLDDVFKKYALYSNVELNKEYVDIRKTCNDIDKLYKDKYIDVVSMDKLQAIKDLEFLYGTEI